jgi:hypothetical protein
MKSSASTISLKAAERTILWQELGKFFVAHKLHFRALTQDHCVLHARARSFLLYEILGRRRLFGWLTKDRVILKRLSRIGKFCDFNQAVLS